MSSQIQNYRLVTLNDRVGLLVALGAFAIAAAICNGATPTPATPESIWPTQEWRTSSPEEEGMDSKELAKLVDWGTTHNFDSLLVQRHGKIVAEAYYVSYGAFSLGARGPHQVHSVIKAIIGTLRQSPARKACLIARVIEYWIF